MIAFPDKLEFAALPTPLQPLDRLSKEIGGPRIWIKRDDMTGSDLTGNKVRKLEYTLARAIDGGADTLITCGGLQSNHCRATALLGARLGLKVHLILRGVTRSKTPDGNLFLDYLSGAEVSQYAREKYNAELPELFNRWHQHYESQGRKVYRIPTGASDGVGVWGYLNCARELGRQIERQELRPAAIFHATGSGGTQAGLTAGAELFMVGTPVIGMAVCDGADYFLNKVRSDLREWRTLYDTSVDVDGLTIRVNDEYVGSGYAKASPEVFDTIKLVASREGIILDPVYTGKAFHGMLEEIRKGKFARAKDLIFIHTGGIFGLFAQRNAFSVIS